MGTHQSEEGKTACEAWCRFLLSDGRSNTPCPGEPAHTLPSTVCHSRVTMITLAHSPGGTWSDGTGLSSENQCQPVERAIGHLLAPSRLFWCVLSQPCPKDNAWPACSAV